ncbi:MAG TPA: hypothetical protein VMI54_03530, partial [Polyangiaceae bacterium]|nr:hypothetical protein [Polyangiaceae bacterium]
MRTSLDRVRSTRPSAPPVERAPTLPAPPIRLRFVLLFTLAAGAVAWLYPRLDAAWKVHTLATALADYGACMVGPTGPALLRDRELADFRVLVRRRLVTSPAADAPFDRCAPFARAITEDAAVEAAHRASAFTFAEYGGNARPTHALAELAVTPEPLIRQARRAWPFVRGYAALVKPSLGVKEAPHPVAPATPALGRGLTPARAYYRVARVTPDGIVFARGAGANLEVWKSNDGGASFKPAPDALARDFAERCPTGGDGRSFVLRGDGEATSVVSVGPNGDVSAASLARSGENVLAVACDERALVAALRPEHAARATLAQCSFAGPCAALPAPNVGRADLGLDYPLDLAR